MTWLGKLIAFFTGSNSDKTLDLVDKAIYTDQEKAADAKEETKNEQDFTANVLANTSIDITNRTIRPVITYYYLGGFIGWWRLPKLSEIDPFNFQIFLIIITFWFGGRMLVKDLPVAIAAFVALRDKVKKGIIK